MKFYKTLSGLVLAASLVVGSTTTFAATNTEVMTALKALPGVTSSQLASAENYLTANQIDASKLDTAKANIDAVATLATAKGVTDITKLSAEDKATVVNKIETAASAIGLNATLSTVNGKAVISLTDSNGKLVASFGSTSGTAMKTTGTDNGNLMAVGGAMIALAAAALAFRKKELN